MIRHSNIVFGDEWKMCTPVAIWQQTTINFDDNDVIMVKFKHEYAEILHPPIHPSLQRHSIQYFMFWAMRGNATKCLFIPSNHAHVVIIEKALMN